MAQKNIVIRYWGRKPLQLARNYIAEYSNPGETILDGFGGSGVFVKTALELDRRAIYIDLNPFAALIARSSVEGCDSNDYQRAIEKVLSRETIRVKVKGKCVDIKPQKLFYVRCNCGRGVEAKFVKFTRIYEALLNRAPELVGVRKTVFQKIRRKGKVTHDELHSSTSEISTQTLTSVVKWLIRQGLVKETEAPISAQLLGKCKCGRTSVTFDLVAWTTESPLRGLRWYPTDRLVYDNGRPFLKKRDASHINEYFLDRSLVLLSEMWHDIKSLKANKSVKRSLYLTFLTTLARSSKMCRDSGGTWPINSYWVPRNFVVKNPYHVFAVAAKQMLGILKCAPRYRCGNIEKVIGKRSSIAFMVADTTKINLPKHSVDYVLIDPPHTDEAQFFELSLFYTSWLKEKLDFKNELIINSKQGKALGNYLGLLESASKQIHRALKPNKYFTVVLHEEDRQVLEKCAETIRDVGFDLTKEDQVDDYSIFTFRKPGWFSSALRATLSHF